MTSQRQQQLRSSAACRRRLDDLYGPILDRMDDGEFNGEGGSDAYDVAIAELKEAYLATPNLGCMMNEEWDTFFRSHAFDPVEIQEFDEPDEASAANRQGILCMPRSDMDGVIRHPIDERDARWKQMKECYLKSIDDPKCRSEEAKMIDMERMDIKRNRSSTACRARLEELFEPIKDAKKNGAYIGEEGHMLYQVHLEQAKREYLDTPGYLGDRKGIELDKYIDGLNDTGELVKKVDEEETRKAKEKQEKVFCLLVKMAPLMQQFNGTFSKWKNTRIGNINWLQLKAASLDEEQTRTNKRIKDSTERSTVSSAAGACAVFGVPKTQNLRKAHDDVVTRLQEDNEQINKLISCIKLLEPLSAEIEAELNRPRGEELQMVFHIEDDVLNAAKICVKAVKALRVDDGFAIVMRNLSFALEMIQSIFKMNEDEGSKSDKGNDFRKVAMTLGVHLEEIGRRCAKDEGSKSEKGKELQILAMMLDGHFQEVCRKCVKELKYMTEAEDALRPLLKRQPLTIGNADMLT